MSELNKKNTTNEIDNAQGKTNLQMSNNVSHPSLLQFSGRTQDVNINDSIPDQNLSSTHQQPSITAITLNNDNYKGYLPSVNQRAISVFCIVIQMALIVKNSQTAPIV